MKIVYIGSVDFSFQILKYLISINANITGVVSKNKSTFNSDFKSLSPLCREHNIPNFITDDVNSETCIEWIKGRTPDVIYCFGWSNLIRSTLLNLPKKGVIGFHPTLLPKNRGRHPLIWAKVLGLSESGTSFFVMDEGADTGPLISQEKFQINEEDTAQDLYKKIISNSKKQVKHFTYALSKGLEKRTQQPLESNYWRKRTRVDGRIHFSMTTNSILNLIRALTKPYPGASCFYREEEVIVWEAKKGNCTQNNLEPGKVIKVVEDQIEIKTSDGSIIFLNHEFKELPMANDYII